jgi:NADPH-dependent 2,4-dienoyl-CoA reductase/sulfur reductase-like enzyme
MSAALPPLSDAGQTVVIVGAGLAGLRVAESVREAGFPGRVVLVGDEPHAPYDRPPLSKAVLTNQGHEHRIGLTPPDELVERGIEIKLGLKAVAIDRAARRITLSDREAIGYDRLVIATGSSARILPRLEPDRPRVHYLRGLDDALALRSALEPAARVAVIGAGVIGLEVAAAATALGKAVTVIEAGARVMSRAAAAPIGDFIAGRHREAGVDLRLATTVVDVRDGADALVLTLSDGEAITCDLVVVGVGVTPNDALARDSGLDVQPGGIVVDGHGMSSDPAIYAAGEVAVHFNHRHGRHDRQETWAHAEAHGEHVGRALIQPSDPYAELGSYWTDQYDFTLNVVGEPLGEIDVVRGDPSEGRFLVFHLVGGEIVGVSAINAARDLRVAKTLIGAQPARDPARLADPMADLKTIL